MFGNVVLYDLAKIVIDERGDKKKKKEKEDSKVSEEKQASLVSKYLA